MFDIKTKIAPILETFKLLENSRQLRALPVTAPVIKDELFNGSAGDIDFIFNKIESKGSDFKYIIVFKNDGQKLFTLEVSDKPGFFNNQSQTISLRMGQSGMYVFEPEETDVLLKAISLDRILKDINSQSQTILLENPEFSPDRKVEPYSVDEVIAAVKTRTKKPV